MTTTKRPRGRPKKNKPVLASSFATTAPMAKSDDNTSLNSLHEGIRSFLTPQEELQKSVRPITIRKDLEGKYPGSKIIFSRQDNLYQSAEEKGWRRVTDSDLKELSQLDPYISAIISTRVSQAVTVGRPSNSKFDKGTRVLELKPLKLSDFNNDKVAYGRAQAERANKMEAILDWFQNCGTNNVDVLNVIYETNPDPTFKRCTMSDYIGAQVRNLLTFGRCGRHNTRDGDDTVVAFRPVAIETIVPWRHQERVWIGTGEETQDASIRDAAEYNTLREEQRPAAFVQRVDGGDVNFFTDSDLTVSYFQKQALFDLNGYPWSPIEMALFMVYVHQQTLSYLRNQYVKGIGSKGMLVITSTDPSAQLSGEDLDELRSQFHNYISRNDNSASTPVLAGPMTVNYVSLSPTPRDMEFLQLEEHIVRSLCSAMQISPQEMGYGNLSMGQGGLTQANKQQEMTQGEERGLRMLLDIVYDDLNQILIENFPEARDNFRLSYTGVGEDTKDAVIQRAVAELQTTATMSSLFADSEKNVPIPFGGDVPLSSLFHQNVLRYLSYGRVMEDFFGVAGAANKPEFDFLIDPNLNQAYQALKTNPIDKQVAQTDMQLQGMDLQNKAAEQQLQMGGQQMQQAQQQGQPEQGNPEQDQAAAQQQQAQQEQDMQMSKDKHEQALRHKDEAHKQKLEQAASAQDASQEMDKSEDEGKDEPRSIADAMAERASAAAPKSLADAFSEKAKLKKSIDSYFSYFQDWLKSHD